MIVIFGNMHSAPHQLFDSETSSMITAGVHVRQGRSRDNLAAVHGGSPAECHHALDIIYAADVCSFLYACYSWIGVNVSHFEDSCSGFLN
jgi:hypothetical protein